VRAYREGATRPYLGEGIAEEPWTPPTPVLDAVSLCADPPRLGIGGTVTLRRGRDPIFPLDAFNGSEECQIYGNERGSVAARVEIEQAGQYRFAVIDRSPSQPLGASLFAPQITLELRRDCLDHASGIDCTPGVFVTEQLEGIATTAQLDVALEPGTYFLITGGSVAEQGFTDISLAAWSDDVPIFSAATLPTPSPEPPGPLLRDDPAATPATEPAPRATIDRLARIVIEPERVTFARIDLTGHCMGRPVRLGSVPGEIDPEAARTCIGQAELAASPTPPGPAGGPSRIGTFAKDEPCALDDSTQSRVCIPSGAYVQGEKRSRRDEADLHRPATPAALHRFWIDRYELTVADFRRALSEGLVLAEEDLPEIGAGYASTLDDLQSPRQYCTWSVEAQGREALPITCIDWYAARALCRHRGGDLATSAQWVYAGFVAGHEGSSTHPWGEVPPSCRCEPGVEGCREVAFGRDKFSYSPCAEQDRFGPAEPLSLGGPQGDVSPLGIVGMAGNLREWLRDAAYPLDHPCFTEGIWDRWCDEPYATARMLRGSSFVGDVVSRTTYFWQPAQRIYDVGVRCVYPAP